MEVYVSPYRAPLDFRGPGGLEGGCGIVTIWPARGEDTPADVADATEAPALNRGEDDRWYSSLANLRVLAGLTTGLHVLFRN